MTAPLSRCPWAGDDPLYVAYHDQEWGVPVHDDRRLFEKLTLEGAQAGLSWITILRRRETYRAAFDNFDPTVVARYDAVKVEALLQDPGIIRNRLKVESAINNAQRFLEVQAEFGSFDAYLWGWVEGRQQVNGWRTMRNIPAETETSRALSKDLKKRGFKFVGPTILYAYMQSLGLVDDHLVTCFRHGKCGG